MKERERLLQQAQELADRVIDLVEHDKGITLSFSREADSTVAAAILCRALREIGARFVCRTVRRAEERVPREGYDYQILCGLGEGTAEALENSARPEFLLLDHHELAKEAWYEAHTFNPYVFGFDGSSELSTSGLAYLLSTQLDRKNRNLSWLAVVGALSEGQDSGEGRSLTSLNCEIANEAQRLGYLEVRQDLLWHGIGTRPIHETIASTLEPMIPGLSGNPDNVLTMLAAQSIEVKRLGSWRTIADLSEEERRRLVDAVASRLAVLGEGTLTGTVYILTREDELTPLRDARELGLLLEACCRLRSPSLSLQVCLGDRALAVEAAEQALYEYRRVLSRSIYSILQDSRRVQVMGDLVVVAGEELFGQELAKPVASCFAHMARFRGKLVAVRTDLGDHFGLDFYGYRGGAALRGLLSGAARSVGGSCILPATCRVPKDRLGEFLSKIEKEMG